MPSLIFANDFDEMRPTDLRIVVRVQASSVSPT